MATQSVKKFVSIGAIALVCTMLPLGNIAQARSNESVSTTAPKPDTDPMDGSETITIIVDGFGPVEVLRKEQDGSVLYALPKKGYSREVTMAVAKQLSREHTQRAEQQAAQSAPAAAKDGNPNPNGGATVQSRIGPYTVQGYCT